MTRIRCKTKCKHFFLVQATLYSQTYTLQVHLHRARARPPQAPRGEPLLSARALGRAALMEGVSDAATTAPLSNAAVRARIDGLRVPFLGRASDPEDDRGRVALVTMWGVPRSGRRWRAVARTREKVLTVGARLGTVRLKSFQGGVIQLGVQQRACFARLSSRDTPSSES